MHPAERISLEAHSRFNGVGKCIDSRAGRDFPWLGERQFRIQDGDCSCSFGGQVLKLYHREQHTERERLQNTAQLARNPALRKRLPQQGEKEVYQNHYLGDLYLQCTG